VQVDRADPDASTQRLRELRGGRVRTEGIVTHRFGLDDYGAALAALADSACIKAVMQP
jgi:D-arabinitol dehydrogenase (NADP+)